MMKDLIKILWISPLLNFPFIDFQEFFWLLFSTDKLHWIGCGETYCLNVFIRVLLTFIPYIMNSIYYSNKERVYKE
jgi:hypothetical protein